jgi:DNA-binding LacI/PurR family transcriptional regulator
MTSTHVTINDVARAAGVSKGLVSLALNDRRGVAPETRDRILAAAHHLGWTPNPSARGLSTRRAYALGLILRREARTIEVDPFFAAFIAGVETVLSARGQVLVLSVVPDLDAERRAYERLALDNRVDGFLLTDLRDDDHRVELIERLGMLAVSLGAPTVDTPFPVISRDYDEGIDALVGHLVGLGHREIAHSRRGSPPTSSAPISHPSRAPGPPRPCSTASAGRPRSSTETIRWPSPAWGSRTSAASASPGTSRSPASTDRRSAPTSIPP